MRPRILAAQGQERVNLAIYAAGAAAYEGNKGMLFFLMYNLVIPFPANTIAMLIDVANEEGHHELAQWIANPLAELANSSFFELYVSIQYIRNG